MIAIDRTGYVIPTGIFVILHELGHLFAMWLFECSPKRIKLVPHSIEITRGFSKKPYGETVIAFMGPLVNLVLFGVFYLNYLYFKQSILLTFSLLNLIIAIFNLLPLTNLDGGTIVFNIVAKRFGIEKATKTVAILTIIAGFSILTFGFYVLINGNFNPSLFIIAIYLLITPLVKLG
ncbi:MAG: hypothetical protein E7561_04025 [Ruminococcaceae bacterium]|nr:hypothetical protein [Oscillospiraceae bacterium]